MAQATGGRSELREKWALLLAVVICLFFVHGAPTHSLPFIFGAITEETGWSREQVTAIASLKFLTGALVALVFGSFMDWIGDRRAMMIAIVVNCVAVMSFLLIDALWKYYLVGVALGISGPATLVGMKTIVTRRFSEQPGAAVGIAVAGTSIAGAVIPLVIVALLSAFNWRTAMAMMTLGTWFVALPLFWWATRPRPGDPDPAISGRARAGDPGRWAMFRDVARHRPFWYIAIGLFLVGAVDMGIMQHQVLFLKGDRGMSAAFVAMLASAFAIVGVFSKVIFGAIYDRFSIKGIVFAYLLMFIDPLIAITVFGPLTAAAFVLTRGVAHGALIVDIPILAKHVFGLKNLGLMIGILSCCFQLGFAFGPWFLGRVHSIAGSYVPGFIAFAGFALLASWLVSRVTPVYWLESRRAAAAPPPRDALAAGELPA